MKIYNKDGEAFEQIGEVMGVRIFKGTRYYVIDVHGGRGNHHAFDGHFAYLFYPYESFLWSSIAGKYADGVEEAVIEFVKLYDKLLS